MGGIGFEEFVRPLTGDGPIQADVPLSELSTGHFAVLTWIDDIAAHHPAGVEADIVARWDSVTLRDVYAMLGNRHE
jgi:hypothetical protein